MNISLKSKLVTAATLALGLTAVGCGGSEAPAAEPAPAPAATGGEASCSGAGATSGEHSCSGAAAAPAEGGETTTAPAQ